MGAPFLFVGAGRVQPAVVGTAVAAQAQGWVVNGRMQFHDELIEQLPPALRELLGVPGIEPKTAERLIEKLNVRSARGVVRAARQGTLRALPMIGERLEAKLGAAAEALIERR